MSNQPVLDLVVGGKLPCRLLLAKVGLKSEQPRLHLQPVIWCEPIDKQHAVEMIGLVLHNASRQFIKIHLETLAFEVKRLDDDFVGTVHVRVQTGQAETSLFAAARSLAAADAGVDLADVALRPAGGLVKKGDGAGSTGDCPDTSTAAL